MHAVPGVSILINAMGECKPATATQRAILLVDDGNNWQSGGPLTGLRKARKSRRMFGFRLSAAPSRPRGHEVQAWPGPQWGNSARNQITKRRGMGRWLQAP